MVLRFCSFLLVIVVVVACLYGNRIVVLDGSPKLLYSSRKSALLIRIAFHDLANYAIRWMP